MMAKEKPLAGQEQKNKSKQNKPKKRKKTDNILYWCLAFLAVVIVLFFAASKFYSKQPDYPKVTYDNWEFTKMADMWWFEWQKGENLYTVPLRFNPYEAEEISIRGKINTTKFNSENFVYITFDLSDESNQDFAILTLAATELTQNIATAINRAPLAACVNNMSDACEGKPIKTCTNTDEPVIYMKEGGKAGITLNSNCIVLEGKGFELLKAVDRLLYHWYGIMQ